MLEILKTYVFDGTEHSSEENDTELLLHSTFVFESIVGTPITRVVKNRTGVLKENPAINTIFDLIKKSGDFSITKSCQTLNLVKADEEGEIDEWKSLLRR